MLTPTTSPQHLVETEAAAFLRVSPRTLQRLRQEGTGPNFYKAGRRVIYSRADLEAWLGRSFTSTSDVKEHGQCRS